jgi:hypothetical protein
MIAARKWYDVQDRFEIRFVERTLRFRIYDRMIGCYWEATFDTFGDALLAVYETFQRSTREQ